MKAAYELCEAFHAGRLTEPELIQALVALPTVDQNPQPDNRDEPWIPVRGPGYVVNKALADELFTDLQYLRIIRAMAAAGHDA